SLGLNLAFRLDGLGLLFALLILVIGLLIIIYARYYLSARDSMGRFYAYLMLFMGSMLGIALSENVIQLLIFWELTSVSSFLLISYWQQREEARNGARMALTVTGAGGLALLGGFVLLGEITGSYDLSVILTSGDIIRTHALYLPTLLLILLGAFTKSAQFPFHFWLPNAMAAPTPVSAYLHSATMVKAGVFLLARLFPALSGTPEWSWLVGGAGLFTLCLGAYFALFKHDLKGLLAYSTISHLGLITLLFGIGTPLAAVAGVFHIINHAVFKASLFMAAGIIDHETGTRDMRQLNGLWKYMPHTATLAMIASASMAGVPLLNGFLSKEMFFAEAAHRTAGLAWGWLLPVTVTLAGIFAVAYSLRFIHDVFFNGEPKNLSKVPHEPPRWMKAPVEVLVVVCLLVGIFPTFTVQPILAAAAASVLQTPPPEYSLAIWHGFNPALWMSIIALVGGGLVYIGRQSLFKMHERFDARLQLDAKAIYNYSLEMLFDFSSKITGLLNKNSLQRMLFVFFLSALVLGSAAFINTNSPLTGPRTLLPIDALSFLVAIGSIAAALGVVILHRQRLTALILLGAVGLAVALVFIKFSAPDLALTQLSVEIVTIVLLLLALYFLPQQSPAEPGLLRHSKDLILAALAGSGAAALTWAVLTRPYENIASYFLEKSLPEGGGSNVVNVILVDFRGYDTLGEITVLALAGLGIYAMLDRLMLTGTKHDKDNRKWNWDAQPVIMSTFSRLLLPLALLVATFILLRGHNQPGGGFIAGLITAVALVMQYLANGATWMQTRLPANMHPLIAIGLLIAVMTGFGSFLFGHPFLTSTFSHIHWPMIGDFELASAMAFDLGVYLVVVGSTLLILINLGLLHQTKRQSKAMKESQKWKH
ncbi:MAG: monovalent cation/H+ antiporter subunit A, partial [Moraxellaceae bacterium]|nr:monovalent cation/H+ antiporter subunit A [Moraxellaceae bacterium]